MVYLINPKTPRLPQTVKAVEKELDKCKYEYLIVGALNPQVAQEFNFPGITTVFAHDAEGEKLTKEELESLKHLNIVYLDGQHNIQHMFHSASQRFKTLFPAEIMATTLCNVEKSVQKCIENAVTAVDKKIIPAGTRVISIAGETDVPDTAIVIDPSSSKRIIDTRIIKIICHLHHQEW